jgi:tetratricopeptide (TPR) repeat protein
MADSSWDKAKSHVDDGQFDAAIPLLFDAVRDDDQNADAYNLLGFTHRKTGKLDAALKYYNKALAIDPSHRGAHEYIGEAFLEMGDVAGAKKHLAFLDSECTFGCSEYNMLKESVDKYEARSN